MYALLIIIATITSLRSQDFTVPYAIGPAAFDPASNVLFFGTRDALSGDQAQYALACLKPASREISPLVTPTVILNGEKDSPNPIYGNIISYLTVTHRFPALVLCNDQKTLYYDTMSRLWSAQPNDTTGTLTGGIVAIAGSNRTVGINDNESMLTFAAVKPASGDFGDTGSGIAMAQLQSGLVFVDTNNITNATGNRATPYDRNTSAIAGAHQLASLNAPIMYFSNHALVIGASMSTGANSNSTLRSVCYATSSNNVLSCIPIVPESAVGSDNIITAQGANQEAHVNALTVMETSTGLLYLIMAGGIGTDGATNKQVHALPLVRMPLQIASKFSPVQPLNAYSGRTLYNFTTPATTPIDMPQATDAAVQVGAGDAPGVVTALYASGDAIFAATASGSGNAPAGIFRSQAILDQEGKIVGWTAWSRASMSFAPTFSFGINPLNGMALYASGSDAGNVHTVTRTDLNQNTPLATFINQQFSEEISGIQGLNDAPFGTPGLADTVGNALSLVIATGFQRVTIATSAQDMGSGIAPIANYDNVYTNDQGTLTNFTPGVSALVCTGGDLNTMGALRCATIVTDGTQSWFVVGGNGGMAVLCKPDGSGWTNPLGTGFSGLDSTFVWKRVGSYANVRTLLAQNNQLYILTPTGIDRVNPSAALFTSTFVATTVVAAQTHETLSDFIVAGPLCLVASSTGWWRNASGSDITTATQPVTRVAIPLVYGTAGTTRLWSSGSCTGDLDLMSGIGGNVYALAASVSHNQAYVFRVYITPGAQVTDSTVQSLPDEYATNRTQTNALRSFWFHPGFFCNFVVNDGATTWLTRSAYRGTPQISTGALIYARIPESLFPIIQSIINTRTYTFELTDTDARAFGPCIYRSATGTWLLATDRGIYECA